MAKRDLELAHLNLDERIAERGSIPEDLSEVYRADQWPRDPWQFPLVYQRTHDGYELKSLGSDGLPGGFGEATDLTKFDDDRQVKIPSVVEFVFECVTMEIWLTAAISGVLAAVMLLWTTTNSSRMTIVNFLVAVIVTGLVSWFIGTTMMALKVAPQH